MVCIIQSLVNYSPIEGHLGFFQFGAKTNKAARDTGFSVNTDFHFSGMNAQEYNCKTKPEYNQQRQDRELTVAQIMSSLLPNSDVN